MCSARSMATIRGLSTSARLAKGDLPLLESLSDDRRQPHIGWVWSIGLQQHLPVPIPMSHCLTLCIQQAASTVSWIWGARQVTLQRSYAQCCVYSGLAATSGAKICLVSATREEAALCKACSPAVCTQVYHPFITVWSRPMVFFGYWCLLRPGGGNWPVACLVVCLVF